MTVVSPSHAHWHQHVNASTPPRRLRDWLVESGSLTKRLGALSGSFRVQRLHQRQSRSIGDESRAIGLPRRHRVREREVLLCCEGQPLVFAHTVVPLASTAADWPRFRTLGEKSLGTSLFNDPRVHRGRLVFARLPPSHPLMKRIRAVIPPEQLKSRLHARRCLFRRGRGLMLVTEVFLPGILNLN